MLSKPAGDFPFGIAAIHVSINVFNDDGKSAHRLKHAWATAGINLHGAMMTVIGTKFVGFVTFDSVEDANKAARILAEVGHEKPVPAAAARR